MSVRQADVRDLKAILFVINKSNSEAYQKIIPREYFKEPILNVDALVEDFRKMKFYAYKVEEYIVGVAALKVVGEETGQVRWVYILPERQRKGVGTAIMKHIESEAEKMRLKKLIVPDVHENAYWARNFYTKLGYSEVGRTQRPWGDNIIYEKTLST
jgi:N-acetylglutamate synthase-like GNAT family acetyltransferase